MLNSRNLSDPKGDPLSERTINGVEKYEKYLSYGSRVASNDVDLTNATSGYLEKISRMTSTYHPLSNVL